MNENNWERKIIRMIFFGVFFLQGASKIVSLSLSTEFFF